MKRLIHWIGDWWIEKVFMFSYYGWGAVLWPLLLISGLGWVFYELYETVFWLFVLITFIVVRMTMLILGIGRH